MNKNPIRVKFVTNSMSALHVLHRLRSGLGYTGLSRVKLDVVGPVDNRPSTD